MKALVVGAGGFLGEAICRRLTNLGDEVSRVTGSGTTHGTTWVYREGLYEQLEPLLHDCSLVVYAAGSVLPRMHTPVNVAFERDCKPFNELLASLGQAKSNATLLLLSTGGAVYGPRNTSAPCVESDETKPVSAYGLTRVYMEQSLQFHAATFGFRPVIFRLSNVYGPGQRPEGGSALVMRALSAVAGHGPLTLWGNGEQRKDFLYVDDVLAAIEGVRRHPRSVHFADPRFNIATGTSHSVLDVLRIIERVTGHPVPVERTEAPATDVPVVNLSPAKAEAELGWRPQFALAEGIDRFWRALHGNPA